MAIQGVTTVQFRFKDTKIGENLADGLETTVVLSQYSVKIIAQYEGVIDVRVLGGIEQGHVGMLRADVAQIVHGGIGVELGDVTHAEFREFGGVMAEPFAQEERERRPSATGPTPHALSSCREATGDPPAPDTRPAQSALHIYV